MDGQHRKNAIHFCVCLLIAFSAIALADDSQRQPPAPKALAIRLLEPYMAGGNQGFGVKLKQGEGNYLALTDYCRQVWVWPPIPYCPLETNGNRDDAIPFFFDIIDEAEAIVRIGSSNGISVVSFKSDDRVHPGYYAKLQANGSPDPDAHGIRSTHIFQLFVKDGKIAIKETMDGLFIRTWRDWESYAMFDSNNIADTFTLETGSVSDVTDEILETVIDEDVLDQEIKKKLQLEDLSDVIVNNPTSEPASISKKIKVERQNSNTISWDTEWGFTLSAEFTMSVDVPLVSDFSTKIAASLSASIKSGKSSTQKETKTVETDINYTCPPMKYCLMRVRVYKAEVNVPFSASVRRYGDFTFTFKEPGMWNNVHYGQIKTDLSVSDAKPASCAQE